MTMNLNCTSEERAWVDTHEEVSEAEWLVEYARAFNTLDIAPIKDKLSPWVTYTSQSVFETMKGKPRFTDYLAGKLRSIKASNQRVVAELATFPSGQPCVALFQASSGQDTNWLDTPMAAMTAKVNALGEAESLLMITCAPSPSLAETSGIFPGCDSAPTCRPKRFVRSSPQFDGVTLYAFYLDGFVELNRAMAEAVEYVRREIEGIKVIDVIVNKAGSPVPDALESFRFNGFPSVGAMYKNKPIFRNQGCMGGPELASALRVAAPIFVAA